MKILIAEDNQSEAEILAKLLRRWIEGKLTFPVEIVIAGTMAAALVETITANVTILDLEFPDSTKEETIPLIPRMRHPVIVVSGSTDDETRAQCKLAGAAYYFVKGQTRGLVSQVLECLIRDELCNAFADAA